MPRTKKQQDDDEPKTKTPFVQPELKLQPHVLQKLVIKISVEL